MNDLRKQQVANQGFFDKNCEMWMKDATYNRKFVVVSGQRLQAVFDQARDAYYYAMTNFQPGEFIIQQVAPPGRLVSGRILQ